MKDEINENVNASIIENLKINIDSQNGNDFPTEFFIEFSQFDKAFKIKFSKLAQQDAKYPIQSSDIYVIDELTGNPVKYNIAETEAIN